MDKPEEMPRFGIFAQPQIEMYLHKKKRYGNDIPVRTEPKINRNAICTKCESGLKYKKCCGYVYISQSQAAQNIINSKKVKLI